MSERILVCVAWPYANGPLHLGHVAGAYLPADIFARYHRTKGNEVAMVSGSDQHGTPITIKADLEGVKPAEVVARYHQKFLENWRKLGITWDLFTTTGTPNHAEVTHDIFLTLLKKGYIYKDTVSQPFCPKCQRYLPDRYVEGTCPFCAYTSARGDQCETCGKPLNPVDLIGIHCRICGSTPVFQNSEHFFLKLSAFNAQLLEWVKKQTHWRSNVLNFTQRYLEDGLKDRAITRDIEWGVSVPVAGFENKRIYVWFEAVIGYLSATREWAANQGTPEKWRDFWQKPDTKIYNFIGKDNIPFHCIIWPAMLMGYGGLNLPYDVPANEFLTIEGRKISTSRNWAVWLPDYLSRYDPEPLRYLLSINMPETSDTDFSWREFVRRNNDELVATYGNLAHRVLTFTYKNFDGAIPTPGQFDDDDKSILDLAKKTVETVDGLLYKCVFKESVRTAMSLAQETNRYLDRKSPWRVIKQDRQASGTALYVAITVLSALSIILYPFLPFSSQKLWQYLGFKDAVQNGGWKLTTPPAGQKLPMPQPLFIKLDEKQVLEEESKRLGQPS